MDKLCASWLNSSGRSSSVQAAVTCALCWILRYKAHMDTSKCLNTGGSWVCMVFLRFVWRQIEVLKNNVLIILAGWSHYSPVLPLSCSCGWCSVKFPCTSSAAEHQPAFDSLPRQSVWPWPRKWTLRKRRELWTSCWCHGAGTLNQVEVTYGTKQGLEQTHNKISQTVKVSFDTEILLFFCVGLKIIVQLLEPFRVFAINKDL